MAGADYITGALQDTNSVLAAPLVGKVDAVHLFLVVGVVLVSIIAWTRILAHFPREFGT